MQPTIVDPRFLQAVAIHDRVARIIQPNPSHSVRMLLLAMSFLSPITAILYIISAIKRQSLLERFWLFSVQPNGFLQPNTVLVIPMLVFLYTIVSLGALISLQMDFQSVIGPQTLVLAMISFPILFAAGWTWVWGVLNAIPPAKYGSRAWKNPIKSSTSRFGTPQVFNAIAISVYAVPFVFSVIMLVPLTNRTIALNRLWYEYEASFLSMIQSNASEEVRMIENIALLGQLTQLLPPAQSLLSSFKVLSAGYFALISSLLVTTLIAYFFIFRALHHQLNILHNSLETRKVISLNNLEKQTVQGPSTPSNSATPLGTSSVLEKTGSKGLLSSQDSRIPSARVGIWGVSWLPSLKRGTGLESSAWKTSSLFTGGKELWETGHVTLIIEQYNILARFTVNAIWQALLLCIVMLFYLALDAMVFSNALDVPRTHTLVDLCIFTVTLSSSFWHLGIGIIEGTISCIVAFSPLPNPPREPDTIPEDDW